MALLGRFGFNGILDSAWVAGIMLMFVSMALCVHKRFRTRKPQMLRLTQPHDLQAASNLGGFVQGVPQR